jgi:signal transduction histidine kinase
MAGLTAGDATHAREEERARLCRELHDGVGAGLAGIILCVGAAQSSVPGVAREVLADIEQDLVELGRELRLLIEDRRPPALQELGLVEALRRHATRTAAATGLKIAVTEETGTGDETLPPGREFAAYRIVTEALMNAARHARATRCDVVLAREAGFLHIRISDDGIGMAAGLQEGVGLRAMRDRAAELGGRCEWRQRPGGGTQVDCVLPLAGR